MGWNLTGKQGQKWTGAVSDTRPNLRLLDGDCGVGATEAGEASRERLTLLHGLGENVQALADQDARVVRHRLGKGTVGCRLRCRCLLCLLSDAGLRNLLLQQ